MIKKLLSVPLLLVAYSVKANVATPFVHCAL